MEQEDEEGRRETRARSGGDATLTRPSHTVTDASSRVLASPACHATFRFLDLAFSHHAHWAWPLSVANARVIYIIICGNLMSLYLRSNYTAMHTTVVLYESLSREEHGPER